MLMNKTELIQWLRVNVKPEDWENLTDAELPQVAFDTCWVVIPTNKHSSRHLHCLRSNDFIVYSDVYEQATKAVEPPMETEEYNPWNKQVGGEHCRKLTIQPLQWALGAVGYTAFAGACHNHIGCYTTRVKDDLTTQLEKAAHNSKMWIYESKKQGE